MPLQVVTCICARGEAFRKGTQAVVAGEPLEVTVSFLFIDLLAQCNVHVNFWVYEFLEECDWMLS